MLPEAPSRVWSGALAPSPTKPEHERLQENEHSIMWVRSFGIAFALLQVYADIRALAPGAGPAYLKPAAYGLVAGLAGFNLALVFWLSRRRSVPALRTTGLVALVADHLFLIGLVWLYSYRMDTTMWALLFVLPLEAALRYEVTGAFTSVVLVGGSELARQAIRYSATWPTAATVSGLTFRVGVLSVIGLLAGLMVRNLQRERLQVELRAAQLVGLAAEKEHLALHDVVTGLPNRVLFQEEVAGALGTASADGTRVAVMIMDLDRFREINDTLGHHNGDAVLQLIAARLEGNAPQSAVVARLGGDEFGVLLANVRDPGAAAAAGRAILGLLETPVCIDGFSLHVEASVGVAVYPEHGEDADQLLQRADVAMYVTKAAQSGVELYSAKKDGYRPSRLTLMGELRRAIDGGELVLYYQPQVHVRGERVHSVEALVRWQHPVRGLIPPDEFIPLAERTGLIRPLTQRVVELAVQQWAEWRRQGRSLRVAANLSARNLHDPGLADEIARLVWKYKVPPGQLELEITESALMGDTARALDLLPKLRAMGIRLAIDDFGTGYSSLAYLKQMPVSQIKIDRSFVRHMSEDAADTAIVGGTVDLAHNLGLEVVAEGVEDRATFNMLAVLGCDVVQGWLVAPALPAADLVSWLDRREQANDSAG